MHLSTKSNTISNIPKARFEVKGPPGTQNESDEDRSQAVHGPAGTQNLPTEAEQTPTPEEPSHE
ncbi:MAG: hypothetical protein ACOYMT_03520 [Chthoniobacterales bacterium]